MCRLPTELMLISQIITTLITWGSLLPKLKASFPICTISILIVVMNPVQRALKTVPGLSAAWWRWTWKPAAEQRQSSIGHMKRLQMWSRVKVFAAARVKRIQIISISFKLKKTNTKTTTRLPRTSVTFARASPDQVVPRPDKTGNSRSVKGQMLYSRR